jgi:DNA-binding NtrC family response regulator
LRLVESAEEALAALEKEEFFMVITDARLGGGMSGYQFLALACKKWPNTPFLMITAYATPKLAVEAIKSGAIDYLAKPFAPEELLHAVSRCAERIVCCATTPPCAPPSPKPTNWSRSSANRPRCTSCAS